MGNIFSIYLASVDRMFITPPNLPLSLRGGRIFPPLRLRGFRGVTLINVIILACPENGNEKGPVDSSKYHSKGDFKNSWFEL